MTVAARMRAAAAGSFKRLFSCDLYVGNGTGQDIANGINLSGDGGLVWIKNRDATDANTLTDTVRGAGRIWHTEGNAAETTDADTITSFNTRGFSIGADLKVNTDTENFVAWTFRKTSGFLDIVRYTGDGTAGRAINHGLKSTPGMILIKRLDAFGRGTVYHRSADFNGDGLPETDYAHLSDLYAFVDDVTQWQDTAPTSTQFTVGSALDVNATSGEYVAYVFAHDVGRDIACAGYTGNGATNVVDVGFAPQFVLMKRVDAAGNWQIWDNKRTESDAIARLFPNLTTNEQGVGLITLTATGFDLSGAVSDTNELGGEYIFLAIGVDAT